MEVKIDHSNEKMVITVKDSIFGEIEVSRGDDRIYIVQGSDDLIFIEENRLREFVAAVRAVASDLLGEEV